MTASALRAPTQALAAAGGSPTRARLAVVGAVGSPGLEATIAAFLGDLAIGRSPQTVATYRSVLRRFAAFLDDGQPPPMTVGELTGDDPIAFARWVADGGRSPRARVQQYATGVMRLYAYLVREDIRPDLPLEKTRLRLAQLRGRKPKRLPKVPTDAAVAGVVAAAYAAPPSGRWANDPRSRLRDIAIVETLRGSGLRVAELVSLRRGDLDREHRRAVISGKGEKERLVFFTDAAWRAIWTYLAARDGGAAGRDAADAWVFVRHDQGAGRRPAALTTQSVRDVVARLARSGGVDEAAVTPHRFRAWFATHLLAETGDLAAVQDLLGHESADTTRIYATVASRRLAAVHARVFGVEAASRPEVTALYDRGPRRGRRDAVALLDLPL